VFEEFRRKKTTSTRTHEIRELSHDRASAQKSEMNNSKVSQRSKSLSSLSENFKDTMKRHLFNNVKSRPPHQSYFHSKGICISEEKSYAYAPKSEMNNSKLSQRSRSLSSLSENFKDTTKRRFSNNVESRPRRQSYFYNEDIYVPEEKSYLRTNFVNRFSSDMKNSPWFPTPNIIQTIIN